MSSVFDRNLLPKFDSIVDDDEEILWIEKPKFTPYILSGIGAGIFSLIFGIIWISIMLNVPEEEGKSNKFMFIVVGIITVGQGVYFFLRRLLSYSNTVYAYSAKRVMMRTGFIGTDFKIIDLDKISDIEVNVNFIERMFDVGTVRFFSGRTHTNDERTSKLYESWTAISNPYDVFKQVKQTSTDVKADINYPNALRPETNPGYKTVYRRTPRRK